MMRKKQALRKGTIHSSGRAPLKGMPRHRAVADGLEARFREAWRIAFEAARLMRSLHHARDVRILGSLLDRERFHEESDIDLAVTNFGMADSMKAQTTIDRHFLPWRIDIIPLKSVYPEKRQYLLQRSVSLEC